MPSGAIHQRDHGKMARSNLWLLCVRAKSSSEVAWKEARPTNSPGIFALAEASACSSGSMPVTQVVLEAYFQVNLPSPQPTSSTRIPCILSMACKVDASFPSGSFTIAIIANTCVHYLVWLKFMLNATRLNYERARCAISGCLKLKQPYAIYIFYIRNFTMDLKTIACWWTPSSPG